MESQELRAKYRRRRVKVSMTGDKMSWPPRRISAFTGKIRIWGPEQTRHRDIADWGKHLDEHDLLVKQVEADEWSR